MRDPEDDLIRRQTVIDALDRNHILGQGLLNDTLDHIADAIIALPPAQPKKRTEERTETHACDCISRKASIDAHYEYCNKHPDAGFPVWSLKILEYLPSAQPQRTGRWELIDDTEFRIPGYRCSVCHCECEDWDKKPTYRFCPNCGSFNGGENEV